MSRRSFSSKTCLTPWISRTCLSRSRCASSLTPRRRTNAVPKRWKAQRALTEVARGTNALVGSTKGKRSIANRPAAPYGKLVVTRPGEYLLLDTTTLDVFAMDSVTLRWVRLELTIALDLCSRSVPALRLSPVSTKSVDASLVLYEAISPGSTARTSGGILPYPRHPDQGVRGPSRRRACPGASRCRAGDCRKSITARSTCRRTWQDAEVVFDGMAVRDVREVMQQGAEPRRHHDLPNLPRKLILGFSG